MRERKKFEYPKDALNAYQIQDLIMESEGMGSLEPTDDGDLGSYAAMHFGENNIDNILHRYTQEEVREWYYREYLPDRESDIAEGYDRGQ